MVKLSTKNVNGFSQSIVDIDNDARNSFVMKSISSRGIQGEIDTLRTREVNINKRMAKLSQQLKKSGFVVHRSYQMDEYVELNKELRETKIKEAELVYIRNIL